jgi:predicted nucleotidyltransferase
VSRAERVESALVVPDQAQAVAARLDEPLGDDVVGVYLHGSFALGCGNPNRSDLDLLAVTRRDATPAERAAFATFPEVPRADYEDSLLRDFDDALAVDDERELRYAILTLPRIWATLARRDLLPTKESGAVWALERLPQELRRPLELALESYRTHGGDIPVSLAEFRPYAVHIATEVRR